MSTPTPRLGIPTGAGMPDVLSGLYALVQQLADRITKLEARLPPASTP